MREISAQYLSQDERIEIADLRHARMSFRQVAGTVKPGAIDSFAGSFAATRQRMVTGRSRRTAGRIVRAITGGASRPLSRCGSWVAELLAQRWSPEQVSRLLQLRFPDEPAVRLCHESPVCH